MLVPGAGGAPSYWDLVVALLRDRGHVAVAVDLPGPDPAAGLPEYTDRVLSAVGDGRGVVVVGLSMGAFPSVMACARTPVDQLVLLNAMIPAPGETPGDWWGNTGSEPARLAAAEAGGYPTDFDLKTYFLHDVPPEIVLDDRDEADIAFSHPCDITAWPSVPTRVVAAESDRFFPAPFQARLARERVGVEAEYVPGGHLNALSHPAELVDYLVTSAR
ncbi:alpha/beta fold hydrolase [Actinokineospora soli]